MVNHITIQRPVLQAQDIKSWQDAVNAARSNLLPRRSMLHLLYANLALDGHHFAVTQTRTVGITNQRVAWVVDGAPEEEGGETVEQNVINTPWFHRFIEGAMSAVPFGHTVLELVVKGGEVVDVEVVPRANVVPEQRLVLYDVGNTADGINYLEDPYWSKYLIPVGHRLDYGSLMVAAPYIIYKRGGFSSWGQFMELFGQPIKKGTYNQYDEGSRKALFDALTSMGGAGTVVIPEGSNVEFITADGGQGNAGSVFDTNISRCNQEISKIYLGQTLTTESGEKGARALGDVHKQTQDDISLSDMRRMQFLLNHELRPRLVQLGYPLRKGDFRFIDTSEVLITERIKVDIEVAKQVRVPEEYWYKTYGIAMPADGNYKPDAPPSPAFPYMGAPAARPEPGPGNLGRNPAEGPAAEKKKPRELSAALHQLYGKRLEAAATEDETALERDPIWQAIVEGIHSGRIKPGDVDPDLMNWTANALTKAVMGGSMAEGGEQATGESTQLQEWMRQNVAVFSGFKTYQTLRAATDQLLDEEGNIRPFNQFRDRVADIDQEYNVNYLKAEYEHAVASAQMAEQWQSYQQTKDALPFLRYNTAGDDRVRPQHADWNGLILPIDHSFWNSHYPPNGWNCRCDVSQHASDAGGRKVDVENLPPAAGMFARNVGKDGIVFPSNHPYYNAPPEAAANVQAAAGKTMAAWALRNLAKGGADKAVRTGMQRLWQAEVADAAKWQKRAQGYSADLRKRIMPGVPMENTKAIRALTGNGHNGVNMHLRGIRINSTVEPDIRLIHEALAANPAKAPMTVYRDVRGSYAETFLSEIKGSGVGEYIKLQGFTSTSVDPGVTTIMSADPAARKVALRIHVPKGTPAMYIADISLLPAEFEVLLDHGLNYRILGWEEVGGKTLVDLRIVP